MSTDGPYAITPRPVSFDRREPGSAIPRSIRRPYHPSQESSLRRAVAYLATSPAARAAAGAVGRAALS
ncbi:hypothetical protein GCM10009730_56460 [Streptomyces albidochromogenes]|uniref:hypothetical protein n=1 Tax=Streptomyces albidochromogenes TaxID=329524 RepID=UPI002FEC0BDC